MLENGILLSTFAAKYLDRMTELELKEYDRLINLPSNDWDIFYWATGVKPIPSEFDTPILKKFVEHVQNTEREQRFKQPDL
jgi:succinate dehydrogenase assembly factor 2